MKYSVSKGTGDPVKLKGLKSQYLLILASGLVMAFLVVATLYLVGADQWVCISFRSISGGLLVWVAFWLNTRYDEHRLMKLLAKKCHPRYLIHHKRILRSFTKRERQKP